MSVQFADARPSNIDLTSFANRAKEIDVGGDDFQELDDLGVSLLTNPNKVSPSPKGGATRQVSFNNSGEMPTLSIKPIDDMDVVNLDAGPGVTDIKINHDSAPADSAPFVINTGTMNLASETRSAEDDHRQKQALLTKLQRLDNSGIKGQRMTLNNSLEDIKAEYDKLTDSRNLEASLRFQRNALMTFVTGVEMVNEKFGHRLPVKPRLKGWSESVHTNVEDFDEIFEELYDLYKDQAKMHPLLRLVGTLGVSGVMFHLTNSSAERSGIPGMADVLNENPELQRQFAAAMMSKMGGLGNFMSAAAGPGPVPVMPQQPPPPPSFMESRVPFNMGSNAEPPRARREMRGPTGVDDILRAFEAERAASVSNPIGVNAAGVFTPSGQPPTPPRGPSILRGGIDPLSEFMDDQSLDSGSTMNTERRRGRRRAVAPPVGATLNLNV